MVEAWAQYLAPHALLLCDWKAAASLLASEASFIEWDKTFCFLSFFHLFFLPQRFWIFTSILTSVEVFDCELLGLFLL